VPDESAFREMVELCPGGVSRFDREGRCVYLNAAAAALWGGTVESIIGRTLQDLKAPKENVDAFSKPVRTVFTTGQSVKVEVRLHGPEPRDLEMRVFPHKDPTGLVTSVMIFCWDITDRRRAEEKLGANQTRLELASRIAKLGIWDWHVGGNRVDFNDEMVRIYGTTREELASRGERDYFGMTRADFREEQLRNVQQSFAAGMTEREWLESPLALEAPKELCLVMPDGTERWTMGDAITIVDEQRQPVRMLGVTIDITERKKVEQANREVEERFAKSFHSTPVPMVISVTDTGVVLDCNASLLALVDFPREQVVGQVTSSLGIAMTDATRAALTEGLQVAGTAKNLPMTLTTRQGQHREVLGSSQIIHVAGKQCVLSTYLDLTAYKRLQEQLLHTQKLEAVGRLAGGVAHDFNNLLNVVLNAADYALETMGTGHPLRDDLLAIRTAGQRGAALTRQLLAFSRKQVLVPQVVDLAAVLTSMNTLLRPLLGERITIELRPGARQTHVLADVGQLEQVIMNLAVNARDAMPGGGKLLLETSNADQAQDEDGQLRPGRFVVLKVTDTGSGIAPDVQAKMFEPFFTTKGHGQGTGLGLATVHGIVRQSGGTIVVESALEKGTTFVVSLPLTDRVPATGDHASPKAAEGRGTVLLCEDEVMVRMVTRRALERAGYRVVDCENAAEALRQVAQGLTFDLLLTDVVMPGMGGVELAEQLTATRPGLKVLFVSGYTDADFETLSKVDQRSFLSKPFSSQELTARVRELLDAHPAQ
jgi:PAS domain S-box-containing protein